MTQAQRKIKTSKEFGALWQRAFTDEHALISGNPEIGIVFPSAEERQKAMLNMVIDINLMVTVFEELCENTSAVKLANQGYIKRVDSHEKQYRAQSLQNEIEALPFNMPAEERRERIFQMVVDLAQRGCIKTHEDLITPDVENRGQVRQQTREEMLIAESNRETGTWIEIYNPGPKTLESITSKKQRKNISPEQIPSKLRDVNRLLIMPETPEVFDDFNKFLRVIHPAKTIESKEHERLFEENWSVKNYGYFDKMIYIALDSLEDGSLSLGSVAPIGEIKVCARQLFAAEKLTDPVRAVYRTTHNANTLYMPSSGTEKGKGEYRVRREQFKANYNKSKEKFERACKDFGIDNYQFPALPSDLGDDTQYSKLGEELHKLALMINIDALNAVNNRKWADKFLDTYYFQQAALHDRRSGTPVSNKLVFEKFVELGGELDPGMHGSIPPTSIRALKTSKPADAIEKDAKKRYKVSKAALNQEISALRRHAGTLR